MPLPQALTSPTAQETAKNQPIQLFVPTYRIDDCLAQVRECLEVGWTGLGFKTIAFEDVWKAYTGLPHAHFLSSNTVGLHLALHQFKRRYGWQAGDEIITTPLTFISSNHAISYEDLTPVFADIDDSLCLDPIDVARRITPKTKAVLFVGMGGNTGQLPAMVALCQQHGLKLILDAAHMAGTRLNGQHVCPQADATVFSFQAVKNLPTADSGMICFADPQDDADARKLSWLGIDKDTYTRSNSQADAGRYKWLYEVEQIGFKYHGNAIMAGIGLAQLPYLDQDNTVRRQLASHYRQRLLAFESEQRPDQGFIRLIPIAQGCESSTHLFQIRLPSATHRDGLMVHLNQQHIYPGVHYRDNTDYAVYAFGKGHCPQAQLASQQLISLPLHLRLSVADVDRVCDAIIGYVSGF
jgi:dTDP-4-amino-4,6-dideoxygalactose transaminase